MISGNTVTSLESMVFGFIFNFLSMDQDSSCIAPKWQAQPQKNLPKKRVNENATITKITPALITPNFIKEWKNSWKSILPTFSLPK